MFAWKLGLSNIHTQNQTPIDASEPLCPVILHHIAWRNRGLITDLPIGRQYALVSEP